MRTNREKYNHYCAEIEAKDQQIISELIPSSPDRFYEIVVFEVDQVEVTHLGMHRRGIYKHDESDRITKDEVELARSHATEWMAPTLDSILVYYRKKDSHGIVTGAHPYSKISVAVNMAWMAEDLGAEIDRRRELYAPREGHKPCNYCQKQQPVDGLISANIYYCESGRGRTKVGQYCSAKCASNDQCGHEG